MSTYTYEDKLKQINIPNADAIKENELEFARFYETLKSLEKKCKDADGKVVIVGDYDCDGICSSSILKKMFPDAVVCLGDRYRYGYGIPTDLPVGENDLVICTDVGTNDIDTLMVLTKTYHAAPVIIDHHEFNMEQMKKYPYILNFNKIDDKQIRPDYCATGLAYKLYEVDYRALHKDNVKEFNTVKALAAIGTIADVVSVNNPYDDNRKIILDGFEAIRGADFDKDNFDETLGYILDKCGITENPYSVTTDTIQMKVAPLFNAPSRMKEGGAQEFFEALNSPLLNDRGMMITENIDKIEAMIDLNEDRKQRKMAALKSPEYKAVLNNDKAIKIYVNENLPLGLNGLVASNLSELSGKPSIVFCKKPDGTYVGSGRNGAGYPSVLECVKAANVDTLKLGGHDDAFGISVAPDKIDEVVAKLEEYFKTVKHDKVDVPHLDYNPVKGGSAPITFDEMMRLEPFGNDFPKVRIELDTVLSSMDVKLQDIKRQDNPDEYKKFQLGGITFTTFSVGDQLTEMDALDVPVHIDGELNINTYGDRKSFQVIFDACEQERELVKDSVEDPELP